MTIDSLSSYSLFSLFCGIQKFGIDDLLSVENLIWTVGKIIWGGISQSPIVS